MAIAISPTHQNNKALPPSQLLRGNSHDDKNESMGCKFGGHAVIWPQTCKTLEEIVKMSYFT